METEVERWINIDGEIFLEEIGIKEGRVILDLGCGGSHYTIPAAKVVKNEGKVVAYDKDKEALSKLEQAIEGSNLKNIELINGDTKVPLRDKVVDVVLAFDMIHYMKDRKAIYQEAARVLKPEGLFLVYPKHHKMDYPLMELADIELEDIIREIERAGFVLKSKLFKRFIHDDYYNDGCILTNQTNMY